MMQIEEEAGEEREAQEAVADAAPGQEGEAPPGASLLDEWVQCDACRKWRRLPAGTPLPDDDGEWTCAMNPDEWRNSCGADEEVYNESALAEQAQPYATAQADLLAASPIRNAPEHNGPIRHQPSGRKEAKAGPVRLALFVGPDGIVTCEARLFKGRQRLPRHDAALPDVVPSDLVPPGLTTSAEARQQAEHSIA
jgi:hypothetical protein